MSQAVREVLVVDNYDSFTYNLVQLVHAATGDEPTVVRNDTPLASLELERFSHVILSPGPGSPDVPSDVGICAQILEQARVPVLGVCLGHQLLATRFGGTVGPAPEPMHGRVSTISHDDDDLFRGIPTSFEAVRYHSLAVMEVPAVLQVTARSEDGAIMALRHRERPLWGVQFHPESILSHGGGRIIENFLDVAVPSTPRWRVTTRALGGGISPQTVHNALYRGDDRSFWLDSNSTDDRSAMSIMGTCEGLLSHVLEYRAGSGVTIKHMPDGTAEEIPDDVLTVLEATLDGFGRVEPPASTGGFALGYVGYLGYGLKADTCGVPDPLPSHLPDSRLTFAERAVVFDHRRNECLLLALHSDGARPELDAASESWLDRTEALIRALPADRQEAAQPVGFPDDQTLEAEFSFRHDRESYLDRIHRCQELIRAGESYEICLTNAVEFPHRVDPERTYTLLRSAAQVPYGALLRCGSFSVLSASPECFLTIDGDGTVQIRPIKGTRPRGDSPQADARLREELQSAVKDRAENLMIVDLMRNDLNTVCEHSSVQVPRLFEVESFPFVHQLISTVTGRLRPGSSPIDCVRATFPGGSMTGAPKIRTLQIIDRLEDGPRGVYSGVTGWLSLSGALALGMVIRTLVVEQDRASFGVGGAITQLSDPGEEYQEILVKARVVAAALLAAVE